ncbi:DUF6468 domain-containing protein [Devosia sp.]|uniref:DUF6468 domain-containing protein n=1 Tax=Devosia sp. TaxID=1871048 RepID=UPI003A92B118
MFGMSLGLLVEVLVAVLLATTIGYCVILNNRLKRLHSDRDQLRKMVTDLVQATGLANAAIQELKATAVEAENGLQTRLDEAESFAVKLATHINAGQHLIDKIARITTAARRGEVEEKTAAESSSVQSALDQLSNYQRIRGNAA